MYIEPSSQIHLISCGALDITKDIAHVHYMNETRHTISLVLSYSYSYNFLTYLLMDHLRGFLFLVFAKMHQSWALWKRGRMSFRMTNHLEHGEQQFLCCSTSIIIYHGPLDFTCTCIANSYENINCHFHVNFKLFKTP